MLEVRSQKQEVISRQSAVGRRDIVREDWIRII